MTVMYGENRICASCQCRQKGFSVVKVMALIPLVLFLLFALVYAFYEGRKVYWAYRVRELCEMDGGVTVYEKVSISNEEYRRLGGVAGGLPLPYKNKATQGVPYVYQTNEAKIHDRNPEVVRRETIVIRSSDEKILGRSVYYWRRGGDFPTGLFHDSSYVCPGKEQFLSKHIFKIMEE